MQRIALLLSIAAVGGCVSQPVSLSKSAVKAYDVFLGQPVVADTVFRDGDRLNFQLVAPKTDAMPERTVVQMEASCTVAQLRVAYIDAPLARIYINRQNGVFVGARPLTSSLYSGLISNPSFIHACSETPQPDWRVVNVKEDDQWVLLDRHSIKQQGSETLFWGAYDNNKIVTDASQGTPSAQKREHYAVDCTEHKFRRLASYDVDIFNSVIDGETPSNPVVKPVAQASDDYKLLFKTLCAGAEQLKQLPTYKPRYKVRAVPSPYSVGTPVLSAIEALNLQPAAKKLSYFATSRTPTREGGASLVYEESFITTDSASGQVVVDLRSEAYETRRVTWRGLIMLASTITTFDQKVGTYELKSLSFSGDWQRMPIGSVLNYSAQGRQHGAEQRWSDRTGYAVDCTVKRELNADELSAGLTGKAKEMGCTTQGDKNAIVSKFYYLADYGYFLAWDKQSSSLSTDEVHILSVR
ncbi:hypothetical protein [Pseudomonas graminis]|uniref:Lipoprotein n=1 Tax=Pseudomonas graminis TaxID=158627 RepID=A0A1C2ECF6_9PSED|nr:hypothetical protein [Pseudomonas graminis]OCX24550.1 hypothetical protein BBI10_04775 [Pseudomonas graminis]